MKARLKAYSVFLPLLWLSAVPWLLFPTIAPPLTAVYLLLLLLLLFRSQKQLDNRLLPETVINPYLLLFLLLTAAAYLLSPLPEVSLPKLTVTAFGAMTFFLLVPRLKTPEAFERLAFVMALCAGLVVLVGFFTLEWPNRQVIDFQPITDRLPHLSGSFYINYNEMAGTLLIFLPFVLTCLRKGNGRVKNAIFLFNLLILIILLFFTQSRGAFIGLAVMGVTWLLWGRVSLRKLLTVMAAAGLLFLLVVVLLNLSSSDLVNWLSTLDAGSKQGDAPANSWLTRLEIWQVAGRMLADYPVIGAGLYTFDPVSRANYPYETILPSFNLTHAHNLLLQTGTSLGLSGLLSLAGLWAASLVGLWQAGRSKIKQIRRLAAVFAVSTVGYLFFNLYDTITFGQKPGLFVWVVLAGSISLSQLAAKHAAPAPPTFGEYPNMILRRSASFAPFVILIILLASPAFSRNLTNLKLDWAYFHPEKPLTVTTADFPADVRRAGLVSYLSGDSSQALSYWRRDPAGTAYLHSQGTIALMSGKIHLAISWYDLALELTPNSAECYLWRAIANEERGTFGLAEADYRRAVDFLAVSNIDNNTKAYIYYRFGSLLSQKGDFQNAADAFAQSVIYQPDEPWYHHLLGDALTALGDERGAEAAYQKANEINSITQ